MTLAPSPQPTVAVDVDRGDRRRWITLAVLCMSLVIIVMDNTILNVAIPSLMTDLQAPRTPTIQWIIDAYTLVFAGLLLTTGSLSDRYGRKGALQVGIVLFGLGSASAALSDDDHAPDRQPGVHGHRRRADHALDPVDPHQRVPRPPRAGSGDRRLGRLLRSRRGHRPGDRRDPAAQALLVELGVLGEHPASASRRSSLGAFLIPTSRDPNQGKLDPLGAAAVDRRPRFRCCSASSRVRTRGWTDPLVLAGFVVGVIATTSFILWELHIDRRRCSTCASSRTPASRRPTAPSR